MDNYEKEERIAIIADGCGISQKDAEVEYARQVEIESKRGEQLRLL